MKYKIALLLIIFSSILANPKFTASVYWQTVPLAPQAQFMFSTKDPMTMQKYFSTQKNEWSTPTANVEYWSWTETVNNMSEGELSLLDFVMNEISRGKYFNQSLVGDYITVDEGILCITGQAANASQSTEGKGDSMNINIQESRLVALDKLNKDVDGIQSSFKNSGYPSNGSFNNLWNLTIFTEKLSSYYDGASNNYSTNGWSIMYNWQGRASSSSDFNNSSLYSDWMVTVGIFNPKGIQSMYSLSALGDIIYQILEPSNFDKLTFLTASNFKVVEYVDYMKLTTYFDKVVDFKLHLITPGKQGSIDATTSLSDVMSRQRVYAEDYPMIGSSACEDNFGF